MPTALERWLPSWSHPLATWLLEPAVLGALVGGSVVFFVLNVVGIPWFLARVPEDYFSRQERSELGIERGPIEPWRLAIRGLKNAVGVFLFLAGVAMLFLPGQGILTILAATMLVDFPGKRRIQRRILRWGPVLTGVNGLRRRAGRRPLVLLSGDDPPSDRVGG